MRLIPIGKAEVVKRGKGVAILAFGSSLEPATEVATRLGASLVNMRFIKPLDGALLTTLAGEHDFLITLEDAGLVGGAGSAVLEYLNSEQIATPLLRLGLDDAFPSQGSREQVLEEYGLDPASIRKSIVDFTGA